MNDLTKRALSGIVYVVVFLGCIFFSGETYMALIAIFTVVSLWEFSKLVNLKGVIPYLLAGFILYFFRGKYITERRMLFVLIFTLLCSAQLIYRLYLKNNVYPKIFMDKLDLSIRYIILPFTFLMMLPFINKEYHPEIVLFVIVSIWLNDSFAYLVGRKFGKRKLFERISPKKTIEGFFGGLVFTIIGACVFGFYSEQFPMLNAIIISVIISVFGTYGDLVESKFKRQANVKDSGSIMPGHGGILDRLDSLIFVAPFVFLYIHYLI